MAIPYGTAPCVSSFMDYGVSYSFFKVRTPSSPIYFYSAPEPTVGLVSLGPFYAGGGPSGCSPERGRLEAAAVLTGAAS